MKGLKFRFALGVRGYEYLLNSGYPLPSYPTLTERLRTYKIVHDTFTTLLEPLKKKVECMAPFDRVCTMCIDEMEVHPQNAYDKNEKKPYGNITLGQEKNVLSNHILTVLIRGVGSPWKQVFFAKKKWKRIPAITKYFHFTIDKEHPGTVLCQSSLHSAGTRIQIVKISPGKRILFRRWPEKIVPQGIAPVRYQYLKNNIVKYCRPDS